MRKNKLALIIVALLIIAGQVYVLFTDEQALGAILSIISMVLLILMLSIKRKD